MYEPTSNMNPYSIRLFMPDGDPESLKIISKMNWTGTGIEISRESWEKNKSRTEFSEAGIYILVGYENESENEDLDTIYIGQAGCIKDRIDSHKKNKSFWSKAFVFVSNNRSLNRAHITWMEWKLICIAKDIGRCKLFNDQDPKEPILTEAEKVDIKEFLNEILSILPLVQIKYFEPIKKITIQSNKNLTNKKIKNTIIVPAQEEGFKNVFLGENCWYAIRIGGGKVR